MVTNNPLRPLQSSGASPSARLDSIKKQGLNVLTSLFQKILKKSSDRPTKLPEQAEQLRNVRTTTDRVLPPPFASLLLNPNVKERFILGMKGDIQLLKQLYYDFQQGNPGYGIPQNTELAKLLEEHIQAQEADMNQPNHPEQNALNQLTTDRDLQKRLLKQMENPNVGLRLIEGLNGDFKTLEGLADHFEKGFNGYGISRDSELSDLLKSFIQKREPAKVESKEDFPEVQKPWDELIAQGKAAVGKEASSTFAKAEKLFMQANQNTLDKPQGLKFDANNPKYIECKSTLENLLEDYNDAYGTELKLDDLFINRLKAEKENLEHFRTTYNLPSKTNRERTLDQITKALSDIPRNDKPPLNISWISKYNSTTGIDTEKLTPKEKEDLIDLFERINMLIQQQGSLDIAEIAKQLNVPLNDLSLFFGLLTPQITKFTRDQFAEIAKTCISTLKEDNLSLKMFQSISNLTNELDSKGKYNKDQLKTYLAVNDQTIDSLLSTLEPDSDGNYSMTEFKSSVFSLPPRTLNDYEGAGRTQKKSLRFYISPELKIIK